MSRVLGILCVLGVSGPGIGADPKMPAEPTSGVWIDPARPYEVSGKLALVVAQQARTSVEANQNLQEAVDSYGAYMKAFSILNQRVAGSREFTPRETERLVRARLAAIERFAEVNTVFPDTTAGLTAVLWLGTLVYGQSAELRTSLIPALQEVRRRHSDLWQGAVAPKVECALISVLVPHDRNQTPQAISRAVLEAKYRLLLDTLPKNEVTVDRALPGVDLLLKEVGIQTSVRASFLRSVSVCEYNLSYQSQGEEAQEWLRRSMATNQRIIEEHPDTKESRDAQAQTYQFARRAAELAAPPTTWPATSRSATSQPATTSAPSSAPEQEQGGDVVTLTSQPR